MYVASPCFLSVKRAWRRERESQSIASQSIARRDAASRGGRPKQTRLHISSFEKNIFRILFARSSRRKHAIGCQLAARSSAQERCGKTGPPDRCLIRASEGGTPRSAPRFGSDARKGGHARPPRALRAAARPVRRSAATRTLRPWDRVWSPGRWVLSHTLDLMSAPVASLAAWPAPPPPPLRWWKWGGVSVSPRAERSCAVRLWRAIDARDSERGPIVQKSEARVTLPSIVSSI